MLALVCLLFIVETSSANAHGLQLGVIDSSFISPDLSLREKWMEKAEDARANIVELTVGWREIAPVTRPAGFRMADPADPSYNWADLDKGVRSAVAHGMEPLLFIEWAPSWAEGPHRPSPTVAPPGTWMPNPTQLGLFSRALAARYSGHFVDPNDRAAGPLPHVRYFEVWGEENLSVNLNPLWKGRTLIGPSRYRVMLNDAYASIHSVNRGAKVIVGGLSPYGDARPGGRIPPVWYWRSLLCLRGSKLKPIACPHPAHFDIAAHNPISIGGPETHALSPLDVSTPDVGRIIKIIRKARKTGRVRPDRPKPFWSTEIWWDSKPPDPNGVPERLHARFITKSIYLLWKQGVSGFIWWYIRDQSHATGFSGTQQSGLFFREGRPKLAYWAFRFPFIAGRAKSGKLFVWGKAPSPGSVVIERKLSRRWKPIGRTRAHHSQIFVDRMSQPGPLRVRARQGTQVSLPWRVR